MCNLVAWEIKGMAREVYPIPYGAKFSWDNFHRITFCKDNFRRSQGFKLATPTSG